MDWSGIWKKLGSDGANASLGATTDVAVTDPAASATLISIEKGQLTELVGVLAALGGTSGIKVGGRSAPVSAEYTLSGGVAAYATSNLMANSTTVADVVPILFTLSRPSGFINSVKCTISLADGTTAVVPYANLNFELFLFKNMNNLPFADGGYPADGTTASYGTNTAAYNARKNLIGVFPFFSSSWRAPAGTKSADGMSLTQRAVMDVGSLCSFDNSAADTPLSIKGLMVVRSAWAAGSKAFKVHMTLDMDYD